jgi:hypothetical protein
MQEPKTYRSDNVKLVLGGTHIAGGMAKDSFIKITPNGGDTSYVAGAYGEIVRTIDPTKMFNVTIQTLYGSATDSWLMQRYKRDRKNGDGMFPMMVKDLGNDPLFNGQYCSVVNYAEREYSSTASTHTWNILVGYGEFEDE